jgi:hypothetical protein
MKAGYVEFMTSTAAGRCHWRSLLINATGMSAISPPKLPTSRTRGNHQYQRVPLMGRMRQASAPPAPPRTGIADPRFPVTAYVIGIPQFATTMTAAPPAQSMAPPFRGVFFRRRLLHQWFSQIEFALDGDDPESMPISK